MTGPEVGTLVGSLGFPIVLVLGVGWFVKRDIWPWYVKYMAERAKAQDSRHREYIGTIARNTEAIEALVGLIARIDVRLEDHTRRLVVIETAARLAARLGTVAQLDGEAGG